uniref:Kinesin motor domain-containing protein n=1 Tax=Hymenolepis diminuta TaxID=6216 RepID=A0A0R3SS48_HYMDI
LFSDVVQSVLEGFNGTIFAYGQTGSGKTFTIQGKGDSSELHGLMPRAFHHIFEFINGSKVPQFLVRVSYLEIYKEELRDLLSKDSSKRLEIRENPICGPYVMDLTKVLVKSVKEIEKVMITGNKYRSVGSTDMNELNLRSHTIFIITVERCVVSVNFVIDSNGRSHIRFGKLNLVDLADSQCLRESHSGFCQDERRKEAIKINLGLMTFGKVICCLVEENSVHIPYRDSKLNPLGENVKTIMVANIGPSFYNYDETINTLRYASRAKNIKNMSKMKDDPKDSLLKQYREEIERFKQFLNSRNKLQIHPRYDDNRESQESSVNNDNLMAPEEAFQIEKQRILDGQNVITEENVRLLEELKNKEKRILDERVETAKLEARLQTIFPKLLGGCNAEKGIIALKNHMRIQDDALEQQKKCLSKQQEHENKMRQHIRAEADNVLALYEDFFALQKENIKKEVRNTQDVHIAERQKQIQLNQLILEKFVPPEVQKKIEDRAWFDEKNETWILKSL